MLLLDLKPTVLFLEYARVPPPQSVSKRKDYSFGVSPRKLASLKLFVFGLSYHNRCHVVEGKVRLIILQL